MNPVHNNEIGLFLPICGVLLGHNGIPIRYKRDIYILTIPGLGIWGLFEVFLTDLG
jgi:hypothetical protein